MIKIALAGNPNCGKTTLFNSLTGSRQRVGNWPGVTVEKKEGLLKGREDVVIQDLPGIYSLSPYTLEEVVAREYLVHDKPDAIINIVDGTNIERSFYLTSQLLELEIPMIIAINMMDLVKKNNDHIDIEKLSKGLNVEMVEISALKNSNLTSMIDKVIMVSKDKKISHVNIYDGELLKALEKIGTLIKNDINIEQVNYYAVKLFERDEKINEELKLNKKISDEIDLIIKKTEDIYDDDSESIIASSRYEYIGKLIEKTVKKGKSKHELSLSDKIDKIITNRFLALPIFVLVMFGVYTIAMGSTSISFGTMATDWVNDVFFGEMVPEFVGGLLSTLGVSEALSSLILDGIIVGVGAVLGFVPQILVLFLLLAIMEDCGYMARVAFIMDRIFRKFGLSGKSFIPMLVATGCGVPGIMASRTIEQERDRKMTIITTGFIPCSAKMPIIGLFAGALFGDNPLVATSSFFIGIAAVVISGIILKKTKLFAGDAAPFVMELPAYHLPSLSNVLKSTFEKGWSFIKRAGTVILLSSIVLWFLQGFGFVDGNFVMVEDNNMSLLASIGNAVAWLFYPLGWIGDMAWKAIVATFTGLIAKEEVVNTFGVLYHTASELSEDGHEIWSLIAQDFTYLSAYSFMIFNLLCAPCFAAMGAIKKEMNSGKWTIFAIAYMCIFAYVISMMVYQIGGIITGETSFNIFTVIAIILLITLIYLLFRKGHKSE